MHEEDNKPALHGRVCVSECMRQEWHDVSEELPQDGETCIVFCRVLTGRQYRIAKRVKGEWFDQAVMRIDDTFVSHWMPLYEPDWKKGR